MIEVFIPKENERVFFKGWSLPDSPIFIWLKDNVGLRYSKLYANNEFCYRFDDTGGYFYFKDKDKAVLFKLTWGGT